MFLHQSVCALIHRCMLICLFILLKICMRKGSHRCPFTFTCTLIISFLEALPVFFSVLFAVFLTFTIAWKGITYSKCNQHTFGEMQIYTHTHIQTQTLYFYPLRTCGSSSGADILIPCRQFAN